MPELWNILMGSPWLAAGVAFCVLMIVGVVASMRQSKARASRFDRELELHERALSGLGYEVVPSEYGSHDYECIPSPEGYPTIARFASGKYRCEQACPGATEAFRMSLWFGRPPYEGRTLLDELENKADLEPALMLLLSGVLPDLVAFAEPACHVEGVTGGVHLGDEVEIAWDYSDASLGSTPLATEDPAALVQAVKAVAEVVDGLAAREPLTPAQLLDAAEAEEAHSSLMAAKLLVSRHARSSEGVLFIEGLLTDKRTPERYTLMGWALDPRVVEELGEERFLERRINAIKSCSPQDASPLCRDLLTRYSPGDVAEAVELADPTDDGWSSNSGLAAALVWHVLEGGYEVDVARPWLERFMPHMTSSHTDFFRGMDVDEEDLFARVRGIAGPDALAGLWTCRLDEVWDAEFEARLPEVLAAYRMGVASTIGLAKEVLRREVVGAIVPALGALDRVKGMTYGIYDSGELRDLIAQLAALRDTFEGGDGGLTLVGAGAEGGLEVARAGSGALEVTLGFDEDSEEASVDEVAQVQSKR